MQKFHLKLYKKFAFYRKLTDALKELVVPGFGGVPLFYILSFFIREIVNEDINIRASAIAFNFFLALFPALIFLFTLIPYMPLEDLHDEIIELFQQLLPENAFLTIVDVLEDILETRRGGLLSFGFLFTLFFATNGIYSLMEAFNRNDPRSFWTKRLIAAGLTVGFSLLLIIGFSLLIFGQFIISNYADFQGGIFMVFMGIGRWLLMFLIIFLAVSILYYFSAYPRRSIRLMFPGILLASALSVLAAVGFSFYVENYAQYHYFYGPLGTIIILMLWFYFQSNVLLIGYELNHSILLARDSVMEDNFLDPKQKKSASDYKNKGKS